MSMHATWEAQTIDEWTERTADRGCISYRIAGNQKAGFVYSAAVGVRSISVVATQGPPTREKVEAFFAKILAYGIECLFRVRKLRESVGTAPKVGNRTVRMGRLS